MKEMDISFDASEDYDTFDSNDLDAFLPNSNANHDIFNSDTDFKRKVTSMRLIDSIVNTKKQLRKKSGLICKWSPALFAGW